MIGRREVARATREWPYQRPIDVRLPKTLPSGKAWPRVSIVTPSFNQGRYIEDTILSVRNQGYPNVEHIIIDGGSSDETLEIIERYKGGFAFVVSEKDRGQSHAINKGMSHATGEIVTWLNSDDMLAPGALAAAAMAFYTSGADMVAGIAEIYRDGVLIDRHMTACDNGILPLDDILDLECGWMTGQFFYQPEVLFRRSMWDKAGGEVSENLHYSMDYELWLRFAECGALIHPIGRPIAWFRQHSAQKTHNPEHFMAELRVVRDEYLRRTGRTLRNQRRPPQAGRQLRALFLNDLGWRYGAGIAHHRLASALVRGGNSIEAIAFSEDVIRAGEEPKISTGWLHDRIASLNPDFIVAGNLHAVRFDPVKLRDAYRRWPTFIVLHDFWWLTGRCPYTDGCNKYLTGCDSTCPTAAEYPALRPDRIAPAWKQKRQILAEKNAPVLLAQSPWGSEVVLGAFPGQLRPKVEQIRLGLPTDVFRPRDRRACRRLLGLPEDRFIVAFSSSSLNDRRKGPEQIKNLLRNLAIPDVLFVAIGNGSFDTLDLPSDRLQIIGYRDNPEDMARIYAAADVLLAPSMEETFGQVFIEAAACGTPSIGHRLTGVPTALLDGVTGILTNTPTVDELEKALRRLHGESRLRADLGAWGRIHVENEWSLEACYHHFFAMLRRVGLVDEIGRAHKISFPVNTGHPAQAEIMHLPRRTSPYFFCVEMWSLRQVNAQLYFDRGQGFSEADSVTAQVSARKFDESEPGRRPTTTIRFALPAGRYVAFRFDPSFSDGEVFLRSPCVIEADGTVLRSFSWDDFVANDAIGSLTYVDGGIAVATPAGTIDPQLLLDLSSDLLLLRSLTNRLMSRVNRAVRDRIIQFAESSKAYFSVEMWSKREASAQLYLDRGQGFSEAESVIVSLPAGTWGDGEIAPGDTTTVRFALPAGKYVRFRFDPTFGEGEVFLRNPKVTDGNGREFRCFSWDAFVANDAIASVAVVDGGIAMKTHDGAIDPQLLLDLSSQPLSVRPWTKWFLSR